MATITSSTALTVRANITSVLLLAASGVWAYVALEIAHYFFGVGR